MSGRFSVNRRLHNHRRQSLKNRLHRHRPSRRLGLKQLLRLHLVKHQSRCRRLQHRHRLPFLHLYLASQRRRPRLRFKLHRHQYRYPSPLHRLRGSAKGNESVYSLIPRILGQKCSWLKTQKGQDRDRPFRQEPLSRFSMATCRTADGSIPSAVTSARKAGWLRNSFNRNPDRLFHRAHQTQRAMIVSSPSVL